MADFSILDRADQETDAPDWVIRVGIAILFGIAGSEKFFSAPYSGWVKMFHQIGWGDWFRICTGVVELVGAALVLIPRTVSAGIAVLVVTMIGAAAVHAAILRDGAVTAVPVVLAAGLAGFGIIRRRL